MGSYEMDSFFRADLIVNVRVTSQWYTNIRQFAEKEDLGSFDVLKEVKYFTVCLYSHSRLAITFKVEWSVVPISRETWIHKHNAFRLVPHQRSFHAEVILVLSNLLSLRTLVDHILQDLVCWEVETPDKNTINLQALLIWKMKIWFCKPKIQMEHYPQ